MKPFLLVLVSLAASVALAIDLPRPAPKEEPPSEQAIAAWVRQLGDDSFAIREAAQRALIEAGPPALAAVREAAQGNNPEVRRRAAEVVNEIEAQIAAKKPMAKVPVADIHIQHEIYRELWIKFSSQDRVKTQIEPRCRGFRSLEDFLRQQPEWALSEAHLQYALWWQPGIAALPCLKGRTAPVAWLKENLTAEVLPGGATLAVRWKGPNIPEAVFLVRAVADVYAEDTKDARYSQRACRIENLEGEIKGTEKGIAHREEALAAGRYPDAQVPAVHECLRNMREYIKILGERAGGAAPGGEPAPAVYRGPSRPGPPQLAERC